METSRRFSYCVSVPHYVGLACVIGILLAILFPLYVDRLTGHSRAFENVLSRHKTPPYIRHGNTSSNSVPAVREPCLLYLSWFPENRASFAWTYAVGVQGTTKGERIIWDDGTGGGYDKPIEDQNEMNALRELAALPPGLESPHNVTYGRLLIVSSEQQEKWITRYYDKAALPAPIRHITRLLHIKLGPRYDRP